MGLHKCDLHNANKHIGVRFQIEKLLCSLLYAASDFFLHIERIINKLQRRADTLFGNTHLDVFITAQSTIHDIYTLP